jgi:hypothetical protein
MSHPCTCIFAYLSGFKKGGGVGKQGSRGVCNLICRSLFYYYGDYSTILLSVFLLRERGERDMRERGGQREKREERERERE